MRPLCFFVRVLCLCHAVFAVRRNREVSSLNVNSDFIVADHADSARENVAVSFGGGGFGALVSAQGFFAGLKELEPTCSSNGKPCPLTEHSFSMISGCSGGGWGIGLYFNGITKPDTTTLGNAGLRKLIDIIVSSKGNILKSWSSFVKNGFFQPAGINESMKIVDQNKKELVYVAVAFDALDAERPDLITYSSKGYCFLHKRVCHAWDGPGLSLLDVMYRTSHVAGCAIDIARLPPYRLWKHLLRLAPESSPVQPVWFQDAMRDRVGSAINFGVIGPYEKTSNRSATYPGVTVSDGGIVDNGALLPGLAAGKDRLIAVTLVGGPPARDLVPGLSSDKLYLSEDIGDLFGVQVESNIKGNFCPLNQVFPRDSLRPVLKALENSVTEGRGGVATFRIHTIRNDYFHIEEGRLVTMTFVSLHPSDSCRDPKHCIVGKFEEGGSCEFDDAAEYDMLNEVDKDDDEPHKKHWFQNMYDGIENAFNRVSSSTRHIYNTLKSQLVSFNPRHPLKALRFLMDNDDFLTGAMGGKTRLPRLPLLMPRMDGENKNLSVKCALAAHGVMAEVVKQNALHFTESPFGDMIHDQEKGSDNTFVDLKDSKCEDMPTHRCFFWCSSIKGATCSMFTCQCPEYSCFRDGQCQGM